MSYRSHHPDTDRDDDEPTTISLWLVHETEKARLYATTPRRDDPAPVWVPKSIIEHCTKHPPAAVGELPRHEVTLPDWFVRKEDL